MSGGISVFRIRVKFSLTIVYFCFDEIMIWGKHCDVILESSEQSNRALESIWFKVCIQYPEYRVGLQRTVLNYFLDESSKSRINRCLDRWPDIFLHV